MIVSVSLGERSYPIIIEANALQNLPELPGAALPGEVAIISNASVAPLYAEPLATQFQAKNQRVISFEMGDSESFKSLETASRAYDCFVDERLGRSGAVWAVGGGVTGDLAGFVAATWMRGVSWVQVPTTLLAMVDSSVGGKVGVNHPRAKNLIGAFWQPVAVVCDPTCLRTLPPRELRAGMAEVIKYGVIADAEFFNWLEIHLDEVLALDADALEYVIARSCEIKADVVGDDERESASIGRRATLNYGHTTGHGLEAVSSYGTLLHGEAIAIGMTLEARLALKLGAIDESRGRELLERQTRLFERCGLPTRMPDGLNFDDLSAAMKLDKKNTSSKVGFIVPSKLGEVVPVALDDLAPLRECA